MRGRGGNRRAVRGPARHPLAVRGPDGLPRPHPRLQRPARTSSQQDFLARWTAADPEQRPNAPRGEEAAAARTWAWTTPPPSAWRPPSPRTSNPDDRQCAVADAPERASPRPLRPGGGRAWYRRLLRKGPRGPRHSQPGGAHAGIPWSVPWLAVRRRNAWTWQTRSAKHANFFYYLTGLLCIAIVLALLRAVLTFVNEDTAARATTEASSRLRRAVYHHTFRLGTLAFRALGPTEAVSVFTRHVEAVHDALYVWLTVVFREPVKFGLLLAFALVVNFWLALAFLLFAVLVWLVGGQVAAYFRRQGRLATNQAAEQLTLIHESLMLMRLVKVLPDGAVQPVARRTAAGALRRGAAGAATAARRSTGRCSSSWALLAALVLLYVAGLIVLDGQLGVASAIALATALVSLYWPLEQLAREPPHPAPRPRVGRPAVQVPRPARRGRPGRRGRVPAAAEPSSSSSTT